MAPASFTALTGAVIFTGEAFVEGKALLMQGSQIFGIVTEEQVPPGAGVHSCGGGILAPGLIDCQVNGGGNMLFNDMSSPAAAVDIAKAHGRYGTTRLLLTFTSAGPDAMKRALELMREARRKCPGIIGIHFEGPHLSPERRGAHQANWLRDLKPGDLQFYRPAADEVMLVTLAPERATPELIKQLCDQGVTVSLGHSAAEPAVIRAALKAGATGATHLFDGMGGVEARKPGLAGIALDDRDCWCSIIADGQHVHEEVIRLAHRAKPRGKLILVSDAMPPAATESPKPFQFYGEMIRPEGKRCATSGGRLVGGALSLAECVRHAIKQAGIEPEEALRMASTYPAEFLGHNMRFGKLKPGYAADAVLFSNDYEVKAVWIDGQSQGK